MSVSYRAMMAFVHVAESSTFAEAAIKMHITQPALSAAIRKMEEQLGGRLFNRSTRHVELTPEGRVLLPTARRLLQDWDNTFIDMQNLFAMQKGTLTIAAMPSFTESHLPPLLATYHLRYPNVHIRIEDVVMERVIEAVMSGRAELGFTFQPDSLDGLCFSPLFTSEFVLVCRSDHVLAKRQEVLWDDIVTCDFVAMNKGSAVRRWTEQGANAQGKLTVVAETGQLATVGQLVFNGLGVSVVPALCADLMKLRSLVCVPLKDANLVKQVGIITAEKSNLSVAANQLAALARDYHLRLGANNSSKSLFS